MASSSHLSRYAHLAFLLSIFLQLASISCMKPLCHSDERSALLQFKQSFRIDTSVSSDPSSHPKVESWNNTDCCLWDGLECDEVTGHVIGLDLSSSCLSLHDSFDSNSSLFYLSHLQNLNLGHNNFNFSQIPSKIASLSNLIYLNLSFSDFSGQMPSSLGELTKLASLDLSSNELSGEVPSWLENLTELVELHLSENNFTKGGFSWLGKQTKLKSLTLQNVNLVGDIPPCLKNLTQLQYLSLEKNNLKSQIPSWLSNLTQLIQLYLGENELSGPIPESISQLVNLEKLRLGFNHLSGIVRFEMFNGMKHLYALDISGNSNLTLLIDDSINATLSKFEALGLSECNLRKFPNFIRYQKHLLLLALSGNNIEGRIPSWMENVGKETLSFLDLSYNSFSGLENPLTFSLFKSVVNLDLSNNKLQGPLPPWFCNLKSLVSFDLSNNYLSGKIPPCLGNVSDNLVIMDLGSNHFNGNIPDTFGNGSKLKTISLSDNQLEGSLPKSLANCKMLQILDLSGNQIYDKFPTWLGSLLELELVLLRSNYLFGELETPDELSPFPKLHILDLSRNEFTGTIPSGFFQTFNNMKDFGLHQETYIEVELKSRRENHVRSYDTTMYLTNKGMYMQYLKTPKLLAAVDFSSNKFQGDIPESIANLKMINVLNFSNNLLSGHIPSFLRNLTKLESLDLSNNKFSGEIPQQLTELTFLEYFNVSNNQLMGFIPQGKQFDTFENTTYQGNSELCGTPLTKKCGNLVASSQPHDGGSKLPIDVTWKSVAVGYGSGIVVGIVLGLVFYERHQNWVLYTFGRWQKRRPRTRGRRTIR